MKDSAASYIYSFDRSKDDAIAAVALAKDNAIAAITRSATTHPLTVDAMAPILLDTDLARMCAHQSDNTNAEANARVSWHNAPRAAPPADAPLPSSQHGGAPPHTQQYGGASSDAPRCSQQYGGGATYDV